MSKPLIVVGARGMAQETVWLARELGDEWSVVGYLDDALPPVGRTILDVVSKGTIADWVHHADCWFSVAIGSPRARRQVVRQMEAVGNPRFATLVHPSVVRSPSVEMGAGCIVAAGAVLTTEVQIGRHTIINTNVTIAHECECGDFCTIAPGAAISGNVRAGSGVEVGTGACVHQGLMLGAGSLIGMGATVLQSVDPNTVVGGNPARTLKTLPVFEDSP